jgi:hypothetical protein
MPRNNKNSTLDNVLDRATPRNMLDWSLQQDLDPSDFQSPSSQLCNITRWGNTVAETAARNRPNSSTPRKGKEEVCKKIDFNTPLSPIRRKKNTSLLKKKTVKATKSQSNSYKPTTPKATTKETGYIFWLKLLGLILFTLGLGYLLYPTTLVIISSIGVKSAQLAQSATCSINTFRHSSSITRAFTSSLASSC